MSELLTAAQMRAIEQAAIESGEVTGLELMERAGRGVVEAIFEEWPDLTKAPHKAVVLCGPGNNGGDGFVVARLLKEWGWEVEVFLYGDAEKLPPDAKANYELWCKSGEVGCFQEYSARKAWACDLVVDALFGTGLQRSIEDLGELFWNLEDMVDCFAIEFGHKIGRPAIVSVDIPSGICADSGRVFPHASDHWRFAAAAHLTVSFHKAKVGHYLDEGGVNSGKVVVKDIGLKEGAAWRKENAKELVKSQRFFHPSWYTKDAHDNKFSHGHALILTGGAGKTGAARLAARSGSGRGW